MGIKAALSTLVVLICLQQVNSGRVVRVGNEIQAGTGGTTFDRTAFLLHDTALADGVLFAFSAYFRNLNPVHFQLWRLDAGTDRRYRLIHEWPFQPAVSGGREDLYIHSRQGYQCVAVKQADRLGLYFDESPGSVTYTFDPAATNSLRYIVRNGTARPVPGQSTIFDSLAYPYRFSAAAYIDSEVGNYNLSGQIGCPTTLPIPTNLPPKPIGQMGATGFTGPQGAAGATGPMGAPGAPGDRGFMGSTGLPGPAGQPGLVGATGPTGPDGKDGTDGKDGKDGQVGPQGPPGIEAEAKAANSVDVMLDSCSWCASLLNPYLILGLLIWLALVTLLLLVLICCATYHRKRNQAKYAQNLKWAGSQNDLWKNYDASAKGGSEPRVPSYENPGLEPTYDSIEEGRTAF